MTPSPLPAALLAQLHRQLDERHAHLIERLDELALQMRSFHESQLARLDAHEAYHRAHEHRWGALALAARYPFRLAALGALLAWCAAPRFPEGVDFLARLLALWLQ